MSKENDSGFRSPGIKVGSETEIGRIIEFTSDLGELCEQVAMNTWSLNDSCNNNNDDLKEVLGQVKDTIAIPFNLGASGEVTLIYQQFVDDERGESEAKIRELLYLTDTTLDINYFGKEFENFRPVLDDRYFDPRVRYLVDAAMICAKVLSGETYPGYLNSNQNLKLIPNIRLYSVYDSRWGKELEDDAFQHSFWPIPRFGVSEDREYLLMKGKKRIRHLAPFLQFDGVLVDKDAEINLSNKNRFLEVCSTGNWRVVEVKTVFETRQAFGKKRLGAKARARDVRQLQERMENALVRMGDDFQLPKAADFIYLRGMRPFMFHHLPIDRKFIDGWMNSLLLQRQSGNESDLDYDLLVAILGERLKSITF